jgi:hypothetical protein
VCIKLTARGVIIAVPPSFTVCIANGLPYAITVRFFYRTGLLKHSADQFRRAKAEETYTGFQHSRLSVCTFPKPVIFFITVILIVYKL